MRFVLLPPGAARLRDPRAVLRTILAVWRAAGDAQVVHSGVGNPLAWIANFVAKLRGKKLVVVVESPWRRGFAASRTGWTRLYDAVADPVARWSCSRADVALFTQAVYRDTLHRHGRGAAYVTPAVWINDADVADAAAAERAWGAQVPRAGPVAVRGAPRPEQGDRGPAGGPAFAGGEGPRSAGRRDWVGPESAVLRGGRGGAPYWCGSG